MEIHELLQKRGTTAPIRNHSNQAITVHEITEDHEEKQFKRDEERQLSARTWKSCCFSVERDSTVHFTRLSISIISIAFCIFQLITLVDCSSQHMYTAILSLIIGYYLK